MKNFYLTLFILTTIPHLRAQDHVGNSTGGWVCLNKKQKIDWIESVDLYEAIHEHRLRLLDFGSDTEEEIVRKIQSKFSLALESESSGRFLDFFDAELKEINLFKESKKVVGTDKPLAKINDIFARLIPDAKSCPTPITEPKSIVNYKWDGTLLKQNQLLAALSVRTRAATAVHEALYSALRSFYKETNSINTRRMIGLLFADIPEATLKEGLQKLLVEMRKNLIVRTKEAPARFGVRDRAARLVDFPSVLEFAKFCTQTASLFMNIEKNTLGAAWGKKSLAEASDEAKANCPGKCEELWTSNLSDCFAIYRDSKSPRAAFGSLGPTRAQAETWAREACLDSLGKSSEDSKGQCVFLTSICQDNE